uniref:Acyl-CoA oxidase/dehydrogenase middle domain-containing protein n=1 Tax=Spongospora subterranea TaxID=70186 RepID=A0A0H5QJI9_9EUKA|eukprot:CRZ02168.1 hypothetical protein [Spongospora subterranea]
MMYLTKLTLLSPPISILSRERYSRMDVDVAGINLLLDTPYYWSHRRAVMEFLATHPIFRKRDFTGMSVSEQRSLVMEQVRVFTQESGLFCFRDYWENPARWAATLEPVAYVGNNMLTKCGVLFSLFGATLAIVGSDYHRESLWKDVQTLKMRGCFCLTELGHGSDARSIETVAVLCAETKEFILNTPSDSAQKYWIGGLALHCSHGIVFAQLFVDGVNEGVHAFLVRLRDENNNVVSGVHIMDCGAKSGLNGV